MSTIELLSEDELLFGIGYPQSFLRMVEQGLHFADPWVLLTGVNLRIRSSGLRERYPDRILLPFAKREDNDDVACWDSCTGESVHIIHDFSSPGSEEREQYQDFYAWLIHAVNQMIEHDKLEN